MTHDKFLTILDENCKRQIRTIAKKFAKRGIAQDICRNMVATNYPSLKPSEYTDYIKEQIALNS